MVQRYENVDFLHDFVDLILTLPLNGFARNLSGGRGIHG